MKKEFLFGAVALGALYLFTSKKLKDLTTILFDFLAVPGLEDLKLTAYDDGVGNMTIGVGHRILPHEAYLLNKKITVSEAKALFEKDIANAVKAVERRIFVPLTINQKAALTSLAFNRGHTGDNLSKAINAGASSDVIKKFWRQFVYAHDEKNNLVRLEGLAKRREKELQLFFT